ncbi:MAG: LytR C-terminal domain-containing protein [Jatrophihabitantaceae bacterium]
MASPTKRRPLPALILLVALTLLTSLVWWRVLHRDDGHAVARVKCPTSSPSTSVLPRPANVQVSVLNSTSRAGIAKATAKTLTKNGFKVAGYGNDSPKVHVAGIAEIRFGPNQKKDAALLAYYFPGAKMVALAVDPIGKVVVSLGLKFKAVATVAAAQAAMKAQHISLAPTGTVAAPRSSASCSNN